MQCNNAIMSGHKTLLSVSFFQLFIQLLCLFGKSLPGRFEDVRIIPYPFKVTQWCLYHIWTPHQHTGFVISASTCTLSDGCTGCDRYNVTQKEDSPKAEDSFLLITGRSQMASYTLPEREHHALPATERSRISAEVRLRHQI